MHGTQTRSWESLFLGGVVFFNQTQSKPKKKQSPKPQGSPSHSCVTGEWDVEAASASPRRIRQQGSNHLRLLRPPTPALRCPGRATGASRTPSNQLRCPGSRGGGGSWGLWDVDRDGRMERGPKLPRVCALLTLWLQRKHRAKPCGLQLPAPSQLSSPVSTTPAHFASLGIAWVLTRGGCCLRWVFGAGCFALLPLPSEVVCVMLALEEASLSAGRACWCHRGALVLQTCSGVLLNRL